MKIRRKDAVLSEIAEVQSILADIPEENVINRYAFTTRLAELKAELEELPNLIALPESVSLTFRGEPIRGSSGISADFAGNASTAFADAFAAIVAGLKGTLKYSGPIPDKTTSPLMITGVATGSFGFEMELPSTQGELFDGQANPGGAVEIFKELLRVSASGSDDEILDIIEEIHPRAVRKVADFLSTVSKRGAWCGVEFRDNFFKFKDLDEMRVSEARLRKENIIEADETFHGELQGVLPASRNFEFLLSDGSGILRGRLGPEIDDPDCLNRKWLHVPVTVTLNVIQVGQGRPRYSLLSLDNIR